MHYPHRRRMLIEHTSARCCCKPSRTMTPRYAITGPIPRSLMAAPPATVPPARQGGVGPKSSNKQNVRWSGTIESNGRLRLVNQTNRATEVCPRTACPEFQELVPLKERIIWQGFCCSGLLRFWFLSRQDLKFRLRIIDYLLAVWVTVV